MKALRKIFWLVILAAILIPVSKLIGSNFGSQSARSEVERDAISAGAPTGFFNVKWLSSIEDVRRSL